MDANSGADWNSILRGWEMSVRNESEENIRDASKTWWLALSAAMKIAKVRTGDMRTGVNPGLRY
jgi:hypothetical protein